MGRGGLGLAGLGKLAGLFGRDSRQTLRDQVVDRVAAFDFDQVADLAELFNLMEQNQLDPAVLSFRKLGRLMTAGTFVFDSVNHSVHLWFYKVVFLRNGT